MKATDLRSGKCMNEFRFHRKYKKHLLWMFSSAEPKNAIVLKTYWQAYHFDGASNFFNHKNVHPGFYRPFLLIV